MFLNKNPGGVGARRTDNSNNYGPPASNTNNFDKGEPPANEFKNKQINELSDMVKILLEEQRQLKQKLELQEVKMREGGNGGGNNHHGHHQMLSKHSMSESIEVPVMTRKQKEITKRASERTRS